MASMIRQGAYIIPTLPIYSSTNKQHAFRGFVPFEGTLNDYNTRIQSQVALKQKQAIAAIIGGIEANYAEKKITENHKPQYATKSAIIIPLVGRLYSCSIIFRTRKALENRAPDNSGMF